MANAVVQAAAAKGIRHDEMHSEVQYVVAHGIASQIGGEKAVIGSQHFVFEDEGCYIPTNECGKFDALPPEYSHLYLPSAVCWPVSSASPTRCARKPPRF